MYSFTVRIEGAVVKFVATSHFSADVDSVPCSGAREKCRVPGVLDEVLVRSLTSVPRGGRRRREGERRRRYAGRSGRGGPAGV